MHSPMFEPNPGLALPDASSVGSTLREEFAPLVANRPLTAVYALLGLVVVAYVVSVIVRGGNADDHALDGWFVDAVELTTSALCLVRAAVRRPGRFVALALGCGMLAWSFGDTLVTLNSSAYPPVVADLSYLCFYPFAYAAVVSLMRRRMPRAAAPTWLDGSVAGLGAAAVCAAFTFRGVVHTGGHPLTTAMDLAYPIGDVLLLALVVGGTAMRSVRTRMKAKWLFVAGACTINAVGDTFNLLHSSAGASPVGAAFNATAWPIAILLMSLAVWLPAEERAVAATEVPAGFALPGLAALAGLVILTVGSLHPVGRVALALAAATLVCAGVRLGMSVGALRSITEQRHRQSLTDELTGLGNRRYLTEVFDGIVSPPARPLATSRSLSVAVLPAPGSESDATEPTTALLFVDLDKFKEVNDSFGHAVGDELLRQIGPRLSGSLRRADLLVRLGGDEFAAVLPDTDVSQATVVAERLAGSLNEPFHLAELPVQISASIGIAMAPADGTDLATLVSRADAAMYRAKVSHLPFQVYDGALDDGGDPLRLMEELREAVTGGQLVLHFQPQLDLRTGSIPAVEALLRWEHPRLGTIAPLKFLPLAEEAGLMPALTARVLDDALAQWARWRDDHAEVAVSVNISPTNLLDPGFVDHVSTALARHQVPPEALVLEITETSIISDFDRSREVIDDLRSIGIVMSIDDFGAGFTSLAHLANLPVGELKLDRAFVVGLLESEGERDVELVRSTIGLGHALGLRVVAEGIENRETLDLLAELGCDLAQGYLISRPVPADALDLGQRALLPS